MKELLTLLIIFGFGIQIQAQNYCDSVEILITNQSLTSVTCSSNTNGLNTFWTSQDWNLTDKYGSIIGTVSGGTASFSMLDPTNSDTNYICLTSTLSQPAMTIACNTCDTIVWDGTNWMLLSMMIPPDCNGIVNGLALTDTCGTCHQAYVYDFVTHSVVFIDDTLGLVLGATEMLVLPDNPQSPYWNDCGITFIQSISIIKERNIVKVIDLLGRESNGKKNKPLFFIYDDGTVEKKIIIE